MARHFSTKQFLMSGTAITGFAALFAPTAAFADCLPTNVQQTDVQCSTAAPNGYQTTQNGVAITVLSGVNVGTSTGTPSPLLSAGTGSFVGNFGNINSGAGSTAISLGAGSTVNNALVPGGTITGDTLFGAATGAQVNTFTNFATVIAGATRTGGGSPSISGPTGINGNITSAGGTFVLNNTGGGGIAGNVNSTGDTTINNSGGLFAAIIGNVTTAAGNDTVNNADGIIKGNLSLGDGTNTVNNSTVNSEIVGNITTGTGNDTVTNSGGGSFGGIFGNVALGDGNNSLSNSGIVTGNITALGGNDTLTNSAGGTITGNIDLGNGNNSISNAGAIVGNINTGSGNDTLANTLATGTVTGNIDLGSGTDAISNLVGTGVVTRSGAGTLTLSGTNTGFTNAGTVLNLNAGTVAIGSASNMFTGGLSFNGGTLQVTGASSLANAVTLGANGGTVQTDAATTLSGNITGAGGLTKTGISSLTLSGTNTFAGPATVNNGTLILSGGAAIGDTTAVVVNSTPTTSGTLQVNTAETIGSLAGSGSAVLNAGLTTGGDNSSTAFSGVISGPGSLTKNGTGTFTLSGANTYSGGTTVNAGTLAGNTTSLQGNILVNVPGILLFNQTANGTYAGALSGAGTFTDNGAGILKLTGNNSGFSGTTNLNGTISIGAANNIGTGPLVFGGGTLQTTGALTLANAITLNAGGGTFNTGADTTLSGNIGGAGGLTKTGAARLTLSGTNSYSGGTTVSAGILQGDAGIGIQGNVVNNAEVDFTGTAQVYGGNMSGTGSVQVINNALIGFSGNNTYSGTTTVTTGSDLVAFSNTALSSGSTFVVNGTLENGPGSTVTTIGGLSGSGLVVATGTMNIGANNSSTTFSGKLGTGGFFGGASGIVNKVGTGTLTLSGAGSVLTGNLGVNAGTLALTGSLTATGTNVASAATLNVGATGALTSPVNAAAGSTSVINGAVTGNFTNAGALSGSGTVTGAVSNSGSLSPGNGGPGIFHVVNGPFTQTASGTLNIDLTPSAVAGTGYDQVLVTGAPGTAVLGGTLALSPQTGVLYVSGTNYDIVNAAGGISGAFASTTGATISPFLSFTKVGTTGIVTLVGTQQVYRLTVTRVSYSAGIGAGATPNQIAVANGFQGLVTGATGDAATLVTQVDNMTAAQAQSFFDQASPEPYGAYANGLYNQGELFTRQVALQMHGTPNSGGGLSLWGRGYGQWGKGPNRGFMFGSNQDVYGGALGLDYRNGGLTVGAAGGYSHDKVHYKLGNSDGHMNSWQFGGYVDYAMGPIDFDLQAAYDHGKVHADRMINVTGIANVSNIARTATASPSGHLWRVVGTVGYNASLGDNISARPFVGIDWSDGRLNSFTESGAGAADLTVDDIRIRRTDAVVGVDVGSSRGLGLAPYGRVAFKYDLKRRTNNITALFNGNAATTFTVSAVATGRSELDADAGLSYGVSRNLMIFAGYEGTYRNDLHSNGVSAGFRLNFGAEAPPPPPPPPPVVAVPPPPPPPPATQTCPDQSVIAATATCPALPPPPPPPPPAQRGQRG